MRYVISLGAAIAGIGLAIAIGGGGAGAATQTVTLGDSSGAPSQNLCPASINCTYVPFSNSSAPELAVPFDGTLTSFRVNAGSTGGAVELRVLRPAGGGQYTGVGTSPAKTITNTGGQTFTVSLQVKAGDVLGLDNSTSALMFDTSDPTPVTYYYELPSLADGSTAAPNRSQAGYRLLLSAVVASTGTGTTTTTTKTVTTTNTTTIPGTTTTTPPGQPPVLANVREAHRVWREGSKLPKFARASLAPIGTTFSFTLNQAARVRFAFRQILARRRPLRGVLTYSARAGAHRLRFQGSLSRHKKLNPGRYTLTITAANAAGQQATATLRFKITR